MAQRFHISLPDRLSAQLVAAASESEKSHSHIVADALRLYFARQQEATVLPELPAATPPQSNDEPIDPFV